MSNHSLRSVTKALTLALLFSASCGIVAAQTPSPTPANPATRPPGEQTQPPTAPPATQQPTPQTPPGAEAVPASTAGPESVMTREQPLRPAAFAALVAEWPVARSAVESVLPAAAWPD